VRLMFGLSAVQGAWVGGVGLFVSLLLVGFVGRRRMLRRNFAGVQEFGSFPGYVSTVLLEGAILLVAAVVGAGAAWIGTFAFFAMTYGAR